MSWPLRLLSALALSLPAISFVSAGATCCWSQWGDQTTCEDYSSGTSSGRCNTDWAQSCLSDIDCAHDSAHCRTPFWNDCLTHDSFDDSYCNSHGMCVGTDHQPAQIRCFEMLGGLQVGLVNRTIHVTRTPVVLAAAAGGIFVGTQRYRQSYLSSAPAAHCCKHRQCRALVMVRPSRQSSECTHSVRLHN